MYFSRTECFTAVRTAPCIDKYNTSIYRKVSDNKIEIYPYDRILVPTGLILDIPAQYSVKLHPRSGLSYKKGITLANCEGVIDSDYCEQLFVLLTNISQSSFTINHGDRIAQGELQQVLQPVIQETNVAPTSNTRNGGFGSTGLSTKDNSVAIGKMLVFLIHQIFLN